MLDVNKSDWKIQWKLELPFKIIVFLRFAQIVAHVRALGRVYKHMKQGIIFSLNAVWFGSSFGYKGFYSPGPGGPPSIRILSKGVYGCKGTRLSSEKGTLILSLAYSCK